MSEAQRYPEDYDGIIAGDPANNRIRQTFAFLHSWIATHDKDGKPIIPQAKLPMMTKAVVEACDGIDGLKDGIIDDPRRCKFDPAKLHCKAGPDEAACLTPAQVEAARKIYDGAKNPRTGEQIFTGWPRGSEGFGEAPGQSWRAVHHGPAGADARRLLQYFLFHDPNWDYRTHRLRSRPRLRRAEAAVHGRRRARPEPVQETRRQAADVHRLGGSGGAAAGHRRLLRGGGEDDGRAWTRRANSSACSWPRAWAIAAAARDRTSSIALTALEQWVEKGVAPEKLIASHSTNGKVDRTRPLCLYPQVARWKGTGSIDEAANFACVADAPAGTRRTTTGGK